MVLLGVIYDGVEVDFVHYRGVDVNKRTVRGKFLQLVIGDKICHYMIEQLSIFFLLYWPHLGLN